MTEQWLSIVEYARTYQVSDMTVRRRIKTGKLHAILQDGKYFIPVPGHEGRAAPVQAEGREAAPKPPAPTSPRHASQHLAYQQPSPPPRGQMHEQSPGAKHQPPVHAASATAKPPGFRPAPVGPAPAVYDEAEGIVPAALKRSLAAADTTLVDSRALLSFCEAAMRKVAEGERRTVEKFKGKLEALEAVVAQRELEIKTLRQQAEDLQLLVKILEKRK